MEVRQKKILALPEYSAVTATQASRSKKSFKNVTISIKHFQRFGIPSAARNHWNLKVHSYMTFTLIFRFLTSALSPDVSTHVVRSHEITSALHLSLGVLWERDSLRALKFLRDGNLDSGIFALQARPARLLFTIFHAVINNMVRLTINQSN